MENWAKEFQHVLQNIQFGKYRETAEKVLSDQLGTPNSQVILSNLLNFSPHNRVGLGALKSWGVG